MKEPSDLNSVSIYQTKKDPQDKLEDKKLLLSLIGKVQFQDSEKSSLSNIGRRHSIRVNPKLKHHTLKGFGGAITYSSLEVIKELPKEKQDWILKSLFAQDQNDIRYVRLPIGSSDFDSIHSQSYLNLPKGQTDPHLEKFSIKRDIDSGYIKLLHKILEIRNGDVEFIASPWSAPAWMKDIDDMLNGGKLLPQFRQAWANYFVKYIEAYHQEGIKISAITVQNEPDAVQTWESMVYSIMEELDFVADFLGPTLQKKDMKDVGIYVNDHNRDRATEMAYQLSAHRASKYIKGVAYHWYEGGEPADLVKGEYERLDPLKVIRLSQHDNIASMRRHLTKNQEIVFTEGSQEGGPHFNEWIVAMRYVIDYLRSLKNGSSMFIDWNLVLNIKGGPNHVDNFCGAPIFVDSKTGEVHYQYAYYIVGHFSRFMKPGATVIESFTSYKDLEAVAVQNSNGDIIVVAYNAGTEDIPFSLKLGDKEVISEIPAYSVQTYHLQ